MVELMLDCVVWNSIIWNPAIQAQPAHNVEAGILQEGFMSYWWLLIPYGVLVLVMFAALKMLGLIEQALQEAAAEIERQRGTVLELLGQVGQLSDEITHLRTDNERLRAALRAARVSVESWADYASDYYKEKWDLKGDLAYIDAALAQKEKADE